MSTVDRTTQDVPSTMAPTAPREGRAIEWGPAWVGAVVALPVYVVLQLLFVGFGWVALGVDGSGTGTAAIIVSALLAIVALFVGGLACGTASSRAGTVLAAALHGVMAWALTVVGVLTLAAVGGATIAGDVVGLLAAIGTTGPHQLAADPGVRAVIDQAVRNGAGWAALWLGLGVLGAVAGTMLTATATATADPPPPDRSAAASSPGHAHRA